MIINPNKQPLFENLLTGPKSQKPLISIVRKYCENVEKTTGWESLEGLETAVSVTLPWCILLNSPCQYPGRAESQNCDSVSTFSTENMQINNAFCRCTATTVRLYPYPRNGKGSGNTLYPNHVPFTLYQYPLPLPCFNMGYSLPVIAMTSHTSKGTHHLIHTIAIERTKILRSMYCIPNIIQLIELITINYAQGLLISAGKPIASSELVQTQHCKPAVTCANRGGFRGVDRSDTDLDDSTCT